MKRLLIFAHPSKDSSSYKIAKKIMQISEKNNITVDFLDLYSNPQNFLDYENGKPLDDPQKPFFQSKINQADEIVFVYPIWWSDMPGILKNFFDQNFTSGFAFKYIDGKGVGLLEKSARVFCSAGGKNDIEPHKKIMKKDILEFCGLEVKNFDIIENTNRTQNDFDSQLQNIEKILS